MPNRAELADGYGYKKHWESPKTGILYYRYSICGKLLPHNAFTDMISEITCKTCRKRFACWNQEDPR